MQSYNPFRGLHLKKLRGVGRGERNYKGGVGKVLLLLQKKEEKKIVACHT